jgi:PAS domain S-box-containing protein
VRLRPPRSEDDALEAGAEVHAEADSQAAHDAPEPGMIEAEASEASEAPELLEASEGPEVLEVPEVPVAKPAKSSNPFARLFGGRPKKDAAPAAKQEPAPKPKKDGTPAKPAAPQGKGVKPDVPAISEDPAERFLAAVEAAESAGTPSPVEAAADAPVAAQAQSKAVEPVHDAHAKHHSSVTPRQLPGLVPTYLIHNLPEAIFVVDQEGRFLWMNGAAEELTGYGSDELLGQAFPVLLGPTDRHRVARYFARQHLRNQERSYLDTPLVTRDGRSAWVGLNVKRLFAPDGGIRYVACAQDLHRIHFDLEALQRKAKELAATAAEAQAAAQLKGDFLATMSHEIRTPMNGVIGMSHLLLESELDREQRTYAEVIHNSSMALLTLINDILDFSKIEAGKLDIEVLDFDLRVAVHGVAALLAPHAGAKEIGFIVAVGHDVPSRLKGDPGRLRQVLLNLASNAIKFTEKGEVALRVERLEETASQVMLRFSVSDTGIGMTDEQMEGLFNAFSQADPTIARRFGGTGLGLAISQRLVKLMGGEVGVKSEKDRGSSFWFELPLEKQPELTDADQAPRASLNGLRVLVVDPVRNQRQALVDMLQGWGCTHAEAGTSEAALAELKRAVEAGEPYRAVMIDMQTPTLGGDMLGKEIKSDKALADTLMLLLTNLGRRGDAVRAQEAGFAAYLLKPVQQSHLYDALVEVVSNGSTATATPPALVTRHTVTEAKRSRVRVLLVEDNPVNQFVAASALRRFGYQADMAVSGAKAVDFVSKGPNYDIVFMDIQMPKMDGYQCTKEIRKLEGDYHTPIVAMTAHALPGDRERCLAAGMDDYLTKPIDLEELCAMVEKWVSAEKRGTSRDDGDQVAPAAGVSAEDKGRVELIGTESYLRRQEEAARAASAEPATAAKAEPAAKPKAPEAKVKAAAAPEAKAAPAAAAKAAPAPESKAAPVTRGELPKLDATLVEPLSALDAESSEPTADVPQAAAPLILESNEPIAIGPPKDPGVLDETLEVIDQARFDASSMGRPELRVVLAKTFLKHATKRLQRIEEMLDADDAQGVEFEAHGMKGMCLTLGAARCVKLFGDLEQLARAGQLALARPVLDLVKVEADRVEARLTKPEQVA